MGNIFNSTAIVAKLRTEIDIEVQDVVDEIVAKAQADINKKLRETIARRALTLIENSYSITTHADHLVITVDLRGHPAQPAAGEKQ
ncbi:MAG: hypothetical protein Q8K65_06190 [Alphaproteobacteria bacterium]|nr:hypothetical protein [Alphaproteobacteria bacterium]